GSVVFRVDNKQWKYDLQTYTCTADSSRGVGRQPRQGNRAENISPDGKKAAFIKDYNLWVRNIATNQTTQLTTDGVKNFGYATDNAGWKSSDNAILLWSPDSRKIATFKQDERS